MKTKTEKQIEELATYEQEAQKDLKEINDAYDQNKDEVTKYLLDQIMNIRLDLPKVVIGNFEENME